MKITVKDLKKALTWLDNNSPDVILNIDMDDTNERFMLIKCQDKYATAVTIKIFNDSNMMPRITKEEQLP